MTNRDQLKGKIFIAIIIAGAVILALTKTKRFDIIGEGGVPNTTEEQSRLIGEL